MDPKTLPADTLETAGTAPARWLDLALGIALAATTTAAIVYRPDPLILGLAALLLAQWWRNTRRSQQMKRLARLQSEVATENKLLIESINCAPLAFALYDRNNRLLAWNNSYETYYPKTFAGYRASVPRPTLTYADLLRETAPKHLTGTALDGYLVERTNQQLVADGVPLDRYYPDAGWRRVTKFVTPSGAVAGFAVDISESKRNEAELHAEIELRREVEQQLQEIARTDALTAALNRRAFMETVDSEISRFKRYSTPVSIVMVDVDWFKAINDRFGHQTGDDALIAVVNTLLGQIRIDIDRLGRVGGEEFCVLLPNTAAAQAEQLAERLRRAIEAIRLPTAEGATISLTASFGVSAVNSENARLTTLIGEADRAMYVSKMEGRNRVTVYAHGITASAPDSTAPTPAALPA